MMRCISMALAVREVFAKSILNKSKVMDYCINPYVGCEHACVYCYARLFMPRHSGHNEPWGSFVDVKLNAPELLKRQVRESNFGTTWISGVTDAYQPLEAKYMLTRKCLEILLREQWPICIQTKSPLVLRDIDLIKKFDEASVGITICTDDESTARLFEPKATTIKARIEALQKLHDAGITTFAFIGPILPCNAEHLAAMLADKVSYVLIDKMNYESSVEYFYKEHKIEYALKKNFFEEKKKEFLDAFSAAGIKATSLF